MLLVLALILLPLDIFVRRVIVGLSDVVRLVRKILPARKSARPDPVRDALLAARAQVSAVELASWTAPEGGAEVAALGEADIQTGRPAPVPEVAPDPTTNRLMEAKRRARRKFER
jgi:hypothetical protein